MGYKFPACIWFYYAHDILYAYVWHESSEYLYSHFKQKLTLLLLPYMRYISASLLTLYIFIVYGLILLECGNLLYMHVCIIMRANKMTYNHEIGTYSLLWYKQFKFPLGCIDKIKDTPEKGYPNTELFECRQIFGIL